MCGAASEDVERRCFGADVKVKYSVKAEAAACRAVRDEAIVDVPAPRFAWQRLRLAV